MPKTVAVPLGDKIVVRRKDKSVTEGGIILPDVGDSPTRGEVVAVGAGRRLDNGDLVPMQVAEGEVIVFAAYRATEIEVTGERLLVMSEQDVLLVERLAKSTSEASVA